MKTGKLADTVYGRSVHKKLKKLPDTIFHGAAGDDCAMFALESTQKAGAVFTRQVIYAGEHCGRYGVCAAVNQAAAAGCKMKAVILSLMLPADAAEGLLQQIVEEAQSAGALCGVPVADVTASVTAAVNAPVLTVTAVGTADTVQIGAGNHAKRVKAGMDIIMTKWAGLEGSAILADICREQLLERYPAYLVEDAAGFNQYLSVAEEMQTVSSSCADICAFCAAGEGGVFRALWTLGVQTGAGLEILLKKIPIRQETVEICNYLDLNPYELAANGSLLMIAPSGEALVMELEKAGIPAAVIGTVTDNNDRVIVNGDERRFLEPAKADEIFKMTEGRTC